MSTVRLEPLLHRSRRERFRFRFPHDPKKGGRACRLGYFHKATSIAGPAGCLLCRHNPLRVRPIMAGLTETPIVEAADADNLDVLFKRTIPLTRTKTVEGKVSVRLDKKGEKGDGYRRLIVQCSLEGKWILHWGVTYIEEAGSEWDQPPPEMRPPGSVPIKDYAIETPLKKIASASAGEMLHELLIDVKPSLSISAIHFVLKDEERGAWYQYKGRDFKVPLLVWEDDEIVSGETGFSIWPGSFSQISNLLLKTDGSATKVDENEKNDAKKKVNLLEEYSEEFPIVQEETVQNRLTVCVKKSDKEDRNIVHFDTDIPGHVVVHWGVCRDENRNWEIPSPPHPVGTRVFRGKALQTLLQPKKNESGNWGEFPVDYDFSCLHFVLKLNEYNWLNDVGDDFYIPLLTESSMQAKTVLADQKELVFSTEEKILREVADAVAQASTTDVTMDQELETVSYTDDIISEIRSLVTDISAEKGNITKSKEAQENILQEIEKLAAEAYGIFRSSIPVYVEEPISDLELLKPPVQISSGTGTGFEILLQGFNWESHRTGKWYTELFAKAEEISAMGFTTIWLPPPTESVSPEGYMPKDLYNLNSRYGNIEELKSLVKKFHEVGVRVLGDVVLNHRCAHAQNSNGIWNVFGGRLAWDDHAIVSDDPHFQGRGNKSSGDIFHAAPNIDHSQEFVRTDIKEWLHWLREEIGYDGWRLDFVRGFWGGYVKDYLEASEPYFAVGEYWDSLSYTYGQMDYSQDGHRQRIIDWINATGGNASAFDVTTKGILHAALEKCEYWRLSDEKGKPPGVIGWWASRAVTFIENHDTGSTQGHWRFPSGKEMQGYAYILTHSGTPTVFYDHIISHYQHEIATLIALRNRNMLHCRSTVKIKKAERDVYAAEIDERVVMKIGPGYYEPEGPQNWSVAAEGYEYKIWEAA
ncbi:alpha-amylase-like 3 [Wolffia australiana]